MAKIILPADGKTLELPDAMAENDQMLKDALTPVYPDLANATFTRKTVGGVLTVTVVKKAGTKGADEEADSEMKLLFCRKCGDMVKLAPWQRFCQCGLSKGYYLPDGDNAKIFGESAVAIGVSNDALSDAVRNQHPKLYMPGKLWVFPRDYQKIRHQNELHEES